MADEVPNQDSHQIAFAMAIGTLAWSYLSLRLLLRLLLDGTLDWW